MHETNTNMRPWICSNTSEPFFITCIVSRLRFADSSVLICCSSCKRCPFSFSISVSLCFFLRSAWVAARSTPWVLSERKRGLLMAYPLYLIQRSPLPSSTPRLSSSGGSLPSSLSSAAVASSRRWRHERLVWSLASPRRKT